MKPLGNERYMERKEMYCKSGVVICNLRPRLDRLMSTKFFLLLIFYLASPLVILYLCQKVKVLAKLGPVVLTYLFGIVVGTAGLLPGEVGPLQEGLSMITVMLAIPLMLFSANIRNLVNLARGTFLSMVSALVAVVLMVSSGYLIFNSDTDQELWKVGGMLTAVYSGGTLNLAALNLMLDVDSETYLITNMYDIILSTIYIFFLITIGQRVLLSFLPAFKYNEKESEPANTDIAPSLTFSRKFIGGLLAFMVAGLISAAGGGVAFLVPENYQFPAAILLITGLGIGASLIPRLNRLESSFDLGMYLILVFSLVVASTADFTTLDDFTGTLFMYIAYVLFGSLLVHLLLSKLLRIDTDTVMVTSTALICSPPFVPVVAGAIGNKQVIVPGISVGIIGYVIGHPLGYLIAMLLGG